MKTGTKQRQFIAHGDYSSTANRPKKKSKKLRGKSGIFRGFQNCYVFNLGFFAELWFGNIVLNIIN
jgi:hypothetical protein